MCNSENINKKEQLEKYAKNLDLLAKNKSKEIFPNKDNKHASIAFSKLLKYSNNEVIIYDENLNGDIVNNDDIVSFYDAIIDFISRGGKLKIILSNVSEKDDEKLVKFFKLLSELLPDQVNVMIASKDFKTHIYNIFKKKISFVIGDTQKFRLEFHKKNENGSYDREHKAWVSFNNEELIKDIIKAIKEKCVDCGAYPFK